MAVALPNKTTDLEALHSSATANANGGTLETIAHSVAAIQIIKTGTPTFTINFEGTTDGTNYVALQAVNRADGTVATTSTAVGQFLVPVSGLQRIRARLSGIAGADADNHVTVYARALPNGSGFSLADIDIAGTETVTAVGPDADGAASTGNPVQVAGKDGSGNTQTFLTDTDGRSATDANLQIANADAPGGAGAVTASTPRVTLASDDPAVASLSVLDDWDESNRAAVNLIAGQAGIAAGTGVDGATVPRVSLATNVPLPAGTNAIGKLAANDGVDVGDVTINNAAGASSAFVQGQAADGAAVAGNPVRIAGKDGSGNTQDFAVDANGVVYTSPRATGDSGACPSTDVSGALEASSVTKASAGVVYGLHGYNSAASAQFILVYNATAVPADGAVTPKIVLRVAATSNFSFDTGIYGELFSTGICWSNSTNASPFTKAIGAADCFVNVQYA